LTVSVHDGTAQIPAVQTALAQSVSTAQILPLAHFAHSPPQLRSVSVPFLTVSPQVAN
jgi:hypothetical protein